MVRLGKRAEGRWPYRARIGAESVKDFLKGCDEMARRATGAEAMAKDRALQKKMVGEFVKALSAAMESGRGVQLEDLCNRFYEQAHGVGMMAALGQADPVMARLKAAADATTRGEFESDEVERMQ